MRAACWFVRTGSVSRDTLGRHGVAIDGAALTAAEPRAKRQLDAEFRGRLPEARPDGWAYLDLVLRHAGVPLSAAIGAAYADLRAYDTQWNLWEHVPPGVPAALGRLRRLGLSLVVVSNTNGTLRALMARVGLLPAVDLVVDSAEEGVEKPDPRLFQIALEKAGADAQTTVHVGDLYHVDVVGARAAGLRAVLLDSEGLNDGVDCPRVRSLDELADLLEAGISAWVVKPTAAG